MTDAFWSDMAAIASTAKPVASVLVIVLGLASLIHAPILLHAAFKADRHREFVQNSCGAGLDLLIGVASLAVGAWLRGWLP